VHSEEDQCH